MGSSTGSTGSLPGGALSSSCSDKSALVSPPSPCHALPPVAHTLGAWAETCKDRLPGAQLSLPWVGADPQLGLHGCVGTVPSGRQQLGNRPPWTTARHLWRPQPRRPLLLSQTSMLKISPLQEAK